MTPTLRVVLIVVSILTTFMIMRKIRQSKLQIEDSIFWLGFSSILIVFSIFPGLPDLLDDASYVLKNELKYLHKKEIEKWERLK